MRDVAAYQSNYSKVVLQGAGYSTSLLVTVQICQAICYLSLNFFIFTPLNSVFVFTKPLVTFINFIFLTTNRLFFARHFTFCYFPGRSFNLIDYQSLMQSKAVSKPFMSVVKFLLLIQ